MATSKKPTLDLADLSPKATPRGLELPVVVARALLAHASLDEFRPQMTGIGLDFGSRDAAWLCATDGHRLMRMPIVGTIPDGIACGTVWLPAEIEQAELRLKLGEVSGAGLEGAPLIVLPWIKSELTFPPCGQVVPQGRGKVTTTPPGIDPVYFLDALKHAVAFQTATKCRGSGALAVVFGSVGAELDPVRFDLSARGATIAEIVIMPLRYDGCSLPASHRPGYVKPEPKVETPKAPKAKRERKAKSAATADETAHMRAEAA